ncbi:MAG: hypothetical protein KKA07_09085 [Bacteroidetes bacterium]|nr:hypothetical protein [Bacteroidota bacterium]MBU1719214.1 hypothetical protein [Bacteroidota bacterium]
MIAGLSLLVACEKMDNVRYKMAGAWSIEQLTMEFRSTTGSDSTVIYTNDGVWLMGDNANDWGNFVDIVQSHAPMGISTLESSLSPGDSLNNSWYWYPDNLGKRLTFLSVDGDGFTDRWVIYTVKKSTRKRLEIQYIQSQSDSVLGDYVSFKEDVILKRMN